MAGQLSNVPESTVLPKCDVIVRVADLKKTTTSTKKLMYKAEYRIVDDGADRYKNNPVWDMFVIGSDKDPDADKEKTWMEAVGARNLKRLFKKLSLDTTKDVDDLIEEADGQEVGLSITRFIEPDRVKRRQADGSVKEVDNEFAGQPRNRITNYWTPGEKAPQIYAEEEDGSEVEAKTAAKSAKKAAVTDEEEDATPSPKAAKPVAEEAGNGADPDASANGKAETKTASAKKEKELACPECKDMVAKSAFMDHIAQHESA